MRRKFVVLAVLLVVFSLPDVGEETCPNLPSEEELEKIAQQPYPFSSLWKGGWKAVAQRLEYFASICEHLIFPSIGNFATEYERYPNSLAELCHYPHLPFRCEEVLSPLDGKVLVEIKPPDMGALEFEVEEGVSPLNARMKVHMYFPDLKTGINKVFHTWKFRRASQTLPLTLGYMTTFEWFDLKERMSSSKPSPDAVMIIDWEKVPPEVKSLVLLQSILTASLETGGEASCFSRPFSSAIELIKARPYLKLLRNPYTQNYLTIYDEFGDVSTHEIPPYRVPPGDALFLTRPPQLIVVMEQSGKVLGWYFRERILTEPNFMKWHLSPPEGWLWPYDE